MSDIAPLSALPDDEPPAPRPSKARTALLKRLADVVCLPSSRVNAFERAMTADLLVEMLREADVSDRARVAHRLATLTEPPPVLSRLLLRDVFQVSRDLLENCPSLCDTDLVDCVRRASMEHRRTIARRRAVSDVVCEALVEAMETPVIETLLRNDQARLSADCGRGAGRRHARASALHSAAAAPARAAPVARLHPVLVGRRRGAAVDPPALRRLARGAAGGGRRRLPAGGARSAGRSACPARRCSSSSGASATAPPSPRAPTPVWRTPWPRPSPA